MKYHKYNPKTLLYIESIEAEEQPENSVAGDLPDETEHYTLARVGEAWVSVLRPEYEIVDNKIQKKEAEVMSQQPVVSQEQEIQELEPQQEE
jgi:hypothetical protein